MSSAAVLMPARPAALTHDGQRSARWVGRKKMGRDGAPCLRATPAPSRWVLVATCRARVVCGEKRAPPPLCANGINGRALRRRVISSAAA